jgi:hypothetical protein
MGGRRGSLAAEVTRPAAGAAIVHWACPRAPLWTRAVSCPGRWPPDRRVRAGVALWERPSPAGG